ncbi:hypothetical protein ABIG06_002204 [Bradyrhizobium sp. USDA 326]
MTTPGLDVRRAFGFVRDDVLKSTGNKQEPFVYGSLGGEDVPLVPVKVAAVAPAANLQADIRRDYGARSRSATGRRGKRSSPSIPTVSMRASPSLCDATAEVCC